MASDARGPLRRAAGVFALLAFVAALSAPVAAGAAAGGAKGSGAKPLSDAEEKARAHFRAGEALATLGKYDEAIRELMDGYVLAPLPAFLLNIAQVYRLKGDPTKAREYYRKYIESEPKSPRRAEVERLIAEVDAEIARVSVAPGTGESAPTSPTSPASPASPTESALSALPPPPPPIAGASGSAPEPKRGRSIAGRWWFWTAVAVVVAGGGAVGILAAGGAFPPAPEGTLLTIDVR